MALIPVLPSSVLTNARQIWEESIDKFGRLVDCSNTDATINIFGIKAFCKRPKILGLFDRTEQSYDQERYVVMVKPADLGGIPAEKFTRFKWDDQEHAVISVTEVDLLGTVFGYRFLVKG